MNQEIISLLNAALECSVYVSPRDPGLTYEELAIIIGTRAGYLEGEVNYALLHVGIRPLAWRVPSPQPSRRAPPLERARGAPHTVPPSSSDKSCSSLSPAINVWSRSSWISDLA